jgi:hypothetical protein
LICEIYADINKRNVLGIAMPLAPQQLTKNRADLSQFLIHLTKDGRYKRYIPSNKGGFYYRERIVRAEHSLKTIIGNQRLEARSPYGYFKLKIDYPSQVRGGIDPSWVNSVCFSESPLCEIKHFYQATVAKRNEYKKFGLGFWQEKVRSAGGNPVLYIDSNKPTLLSALDAMTGVNASLFKHIMPFYDTFGPLVLHPNSVGFSEFRWEREWRLAGDFTFQWDTVAFGICPEDQIAAYEALVSNKIPFIDPDWDEQTLLSHLKQKNAIALLKAL